MQPAGKHPGLPVTQSIGDTHKPEPDTRQEEAAERAEEEKTKFIEKIPNKSSSPVEPSHPTHQDHSEHAATCRTYQTPSTQQHAKRVNSMADFSQTGAGALPTP